MKEHELKAKALTGILDLSKGTISKILNYHKGLSKDTIRKLSSYFKVTQDAFNRPYQLVNGDGVNRRSRNNISITSSGSTAVHGSPAAHLSLSP